MSSGQELEQPNDIEGLSKHPTKSHNFRTNTLNLVEKAVLHNEKMTIKFLHRLGFVLKSNDATKSFLIKALETCCKDTFVALLNMIDFNGVSKETFFINIIDNRGYDLLMLSIELNNTSVSDFLIRLKYFDLNKKRGGKIPMYLACEKRDIGTINTLLAYESNFSTNFDHETLFDGGINFEFYASIIIKASKTKGYDFFASLFQNRKVRSIIIDQLKLMYDDRKYSPLLCAIDANNVGATKFFIEKKIFELNEGYFDETPLSLARKKEFYDIVELLMDNGAIWKVGGESWEASVIDEFEDVNDGVLTGCNPKSFGEEHTTESKKLLPSSDHSNESQFHVENEIKRLVFKEQNKEKRAALKDEKIGLAKLTSEKNHTNESNRHLFGQSSSGDCIAIDIPDNSSNAEKVIITRKEINTNSIESMVIDISNSEGYSYSRKNLNDNHDEFIQTNESIKNVTSEIPPNLVKKMISQFNHPKKNERSPSPNRLELKKYSAKRANLRFTIKEQISSLEENLIDNPKTSSDANVDKCAKVDDTIFEVTKSLPGDPSNINNEEIEETKSLLEDKKDAESMHRSVLITNASTDLEFSRENMTVNDKRRKRKKNNIKLWIICIIPPVIILIIASVQFYSDITLREYHLSAGHDLPGENHPPIESNMTLGDALEHYLDNLIESKKNHDFNVTAVEIGNLNDIVDVWKDDNQDCKEIHKLAEIYNNDDFVMTLLEEYESLRKEYPDVKKKNLICRELAEKMHEQFSNADVKSKFTKKGNILKSL